MEIDRQRQIDSSQADVYTDRGTLCRRNTDRLTCRQTLTDWQRDKFADRQPIDRSIDLQLDRQTGILTDRQTSRVTDRQANTLTDRQTETQTDRLQTDR